MKPPTDSATEVLAGLVVTVSLCLLGSLSVSMPRMPCIFVKLATVASDAIGQCELSKDESCQMAATALASYPSFCRYLPEAVLNECRTAAGFGNQKVDVVYT